MQIRIGGCTTVLALLAFSLVGAHAQELEWVRFSGSMGADRTSALALDPAGAAYVAFEGQSPFVISGSNYTSANGTAFYISKYEKSGATLWTGQLDLQPFGGVLQGYVSSGFRGPWLAFDDSGSLLVAGTFKPSLVWRSPGPTSSNQTVFGFPSDIPDSTDAFLLRLDLNGKVIQAGAFGGGADYQTCTDVAAGTNQEVFLAGALRYNASFGAKVLAGSSAPGGGGHWIAKLHSNYVLWAKSLAFPNHITYGPKIASDPQGNVIAAGQFSPDVQLDGVRLDADGDTNRIYLAKFSSAGDLLWFRTCGLGGGLEGVQDLTTDASGNIYLAGGEGVYHSQTMAVAVFSSEIRIPAFNYIVKFDRDGNAVWAKPEQFGAIAVAPDDSLYAVGSVYFNPRTIGGNTFTPLGRADILSAHLDSDGNLIWAGNFADSGADWPAAIAADAEGGLWVTGSSFHEGTSVYGEPTFGLDDAFLARYSAGAALISRQPSDQTVLQGADAEFTVQLGEGASAEFQWLKDGSELTDGEHITGSKSPHLRVLGATVQDEGDYAVRITTAQSAILSSAARLHITAPIEFTSFREAAPGIVQFTFQGNPGRFFRFEVSSNLTAWSLLTNSGPNTPKPGEILLVDKIPAGNNRRFYRATSQ